MIWISLSEIYLHLIVGGAYEKENYYGKTEMFRYNSEIHVLQTEADSGILTDSGHGFHKYGHKSECILCRYGGPDYVSDERVGFGSSRGGGHSRRSRDNIR